MSEGRRSEVAALRPLIAETAAARIADRFITAFALGQFVVGQKLPSLPELSAMLEVSQTTVREAISRLAALGFDPIGGSLDEVQTYVAREVSDWAAIVRSLDITLD